MWIWDKCQCIWGDSNTIINIHIKGTQLGEEKEKRTENSLEELIVSTSLSWGKKQTYNKNLNKFQVYHPHRYTLWSKYQDHKQNDNLESNENETTRHE